MHKNKYYHCPNTCALSWLETKFALSVSDGVGLVSISHLVIAGTPAPSVTLIRNKWWLRENSKRKGHSCIVPYDYQLSVRRNAFCEECLQNTSVVRPANVGTLKSSFGNDVKSNKGELRTGYTAVMRFDPGVNRNFQARIILLTIFSVFHHVSVNGRTDSSQGTDIL